MYNVSPATSAQHLEGEDLGLAKSYKPRESTASKAVQSQAWSAHLQISCRNCLLSRDENAVIWADDQTRWTSLQFDDGVNLMLFRCLEHFNHTAIGRHNFGSLKKALHWYKLSTNICDLLEESVGQEAAWFFSHMRPRPHSASGWGMIVGVRCGNIIG